MSVPVLHIFSKESRAIAGRTTWFVTYQSFQYDTAWSSLL